MIVGEISPLFTHYIPTRPSLFYILDDMYLYIYIYIFRKMYLSYYPFRSIPIKSYPHHQALYLLNIQEILDFSCI